MNFLKGCFSTIFCILIFLFSSIAFTLLAFQGTIFDVKFVTEIIDEINLQKLALTIVDQMSFSESSEENPLDKETISDVVNSISSEDEATIKNIVKDGVTKVYSYLHGETMDFNYELNVEDFADVIANITTSSSAVIEKLNLPFEVCDNGNDNCLSKDQLKGLIVKGIKGELTADDIEAVYPKCAAGYKPVTKEGELPNCIAGGFDEESKAEINKFLDENRISKSTNQGVVEEGTVGPILKITSANFPPQVLQVRSIFITIIKPLPYVLLGISALFALFIILMKKLSGFLWIGVLFTLEGALMLLGKLTSSTMQTAAIDQLEIKIGTVSQNALEIITGILSKLINTYNNIIAVYGIILLAIGVACIVISYLFKGKNKEITDKSTITVQPTSSTVVINS